MIPWCQYAITNFVAYTRVGRQKFWELLNIVSYNDVTNNRIAQRIYSYKLFRIVLHVAVRASRIRVLQIAGVLYKLKYPLYVLCTCILYLGRNNEYYIIWYTIQIPIPIGINRYYKNDRLDIFRISNFILYHIHKYI